MGLPADLQAILDAHTPHFSVTPEGKIKCELNGHTFPAQAAALQAFVSGKKYGKLKAAAEVEASLEKYEPFIVKSKNLPGTLFCALTGELLNARLAEVKQHLKGKKFARAQARFQADEQELLEEPSMGSGASDMEEDEPEDSDGPGVWLPEEVLREYEMQEVDEEAQEGGDAAAGAGGAAGADAADGGEEDEAAAMAAAPKSKARGGKGKAQQQRKGQQREGKEEQPAKPARQPRGKAAAAEGGKPKGGKQQQAAAGGGGKAKAPRAKKARTG